MAFRSPLSKREADIRSLPLALRIVEGHDAIARRVLRSGVAYRGPHGLALVIDPTDRFQRMMLLNTFDPVLIGLIRRYARPGQVVLDAGGFIGYVSLRFAQAVGPDGEVHTFECDPRLVGRIRGHADLNRRSNIEVNALATHEVSGRRLEFRLTDQLGWSTLQDGVWDSDQSVEVTTVALDDYVESRGIDPERLGFIKLDVEGAEIETLRGASKTLADTSAAVLIELQPWRLELSGGSAEDLVSAMESHGFEPWAPQGLVDGDVRLARGTSPTVGEDLLFLPR